MSFEVAIFESSSFLYVDFVGYVDDSVFISYGGIGSDGCLLARGLSQWHINTTQTYPYLQRPWALSTLMSDLIRNASSSNSVEAGGTSWQISHNEAKIERVGGIYDWEFLLCNGYICLHFYSSTRYIRNTHVLSM